jgi:uncharacterized lipoprotein YmbA
MTLAGVRMGWLMAVAIASTGCASSPEPQFYALFPGHGDTWVSGPLEVELRRPGLPGYLDRPQIVRREQPGRLEFSGADRWGAPLENMVGSTLAQNLAQRLPSAHVYTESGAISASPDAQVEMEIQRFELTEHGSVELVAQVALHWPKAAAPDRLERYALSRPSRNHSTDQLVAQMSGLLADLADSIARSLRDGPPPASAAPTSDSTLESPASKP